MADETPVVWISHKDGERCAGCGAELGAGRFIQISRETGIRCMNCAGYGDLVFLASGDAALTRRATDLARGGREEPCRVRETESQVAIEWYGRFELQDDDFVFIDRRGQVRRFKGYPVDELRRSL